VVEWLFGLLLGGEGAGDAEDADHDGTENTTGNDTTEASHLNSPELRLEPV